MLVLARLVFIAVSLFMFISLFLSDYEEPKNAISYKIYLFLFVFILNFMFQIFSNLINKVKISIDEITESSINNGLLTVIAFGIYGDLNNENIFNQYTSRQKELILVLLIIGFMATIKILECLISSN